MLIQILLLAAIAAVGFSFLRNRNAMRFRAGKKVLFGLFVLASVVAVIFPEALNAVARAIGVGRGADLLLYGLVVAFLFVALNTYLRFRDHDARLTLLARRIALDQARRVGRAEDTQP